MKSLLLLVLLLTAHVGRAQKGLTYHQLIKLVEVPGAVFVQDSLFMDEAEVANIHWLEYLHFLREDSTEAQFQAALPDSTVGDRFINSQNPNVRYYLRYPDFRYYAVVGVTYGQAVRYCRWRTALVNQRLHKEEYLRKHPTLKQYDFRIEFRLPTVREWELAAAGGLDPLKNPLGVVHPPRPGSRQERSQLLRKPAEISNCLLESGLTPATAGAIYRIEFTVQEQAYFGADARPIRCRQPELGIVSMPNYVYTNSPNAYGLYNMIGNVAELTATAGMAKGGSFRQSIDDITIQKTFGYFKSQEWLGFRCAATVFISLKQ